MKRQKRFKLFLLPAIIASSYIYSCSLNKDKFKDDFEEIVKEIEDRLPSNKTDGTVLPITPIDEVIETSEPEVVPEPEPESEPEPIPEQEPEPEVPSKFLIRWFNHDGTLLEESEVNAGELPHYCGETPQQSNETELEDFNYFIGWDKEVVPATEDANYTAQFAIKEYTEDKFEYILSEDETYYEVTRASDEISGDLVLPSMHNGLPIKKVADNAFYITSSEKQDITSVYIPYGIEEIGVGSFKSVKGLKNIYVPSTVKTIGDEAFYASTTLDSILFNDGVERIGSYSFFGLTKLKNFVFPKSLKYASSRAFHSLARETGFIVPNDCQLEEIGKEAFYYCGLVSGDFSHLKTIGEAAFDTTPLLTSVKLYNELEEIPYKCFNNSPNLTSIEIPESVTTLGRNAFYGCKSLENVELPQNITSIPNYLFYGATNLKKVTCLGEITSIGDFAFAHTSLNELVINDINKITSLGEGTMKNNNYFLQFPEGIGLINNHTYEENKVIENISLPDHIKTIGEYAFASCPNLKHIDLNNVETIMYRAFYGSSLEEIVLSSKITTYGNSIFENCLNLTTATFPEDMQEIPAGILKGCTSITTLNLPESLTSIGSDAFNGCEGITNINLPSTLTSIGEAAFSSTGIVELTVPSSVIENYRAFKENSTLKTITFEEGTQKLDSGVLYNCTSLETINLPSTITSLGTISVAGCTSLKNINYAGTVEQWNAIQKLTSSSGSGRGRRYYEWNNSNGTKVTGFTVNCSDGEVAY